MEKSIESIWKEGFLNEDALVVPKINDLYNQKSRHIVDKFKRMFKINLIALVAFSVLFLVYSIFNGILFMGITSFLIMNSIVIVNRKLSKGLEKIDKGMSSYQYLKSFDDWMKGQLSLNTKMARVYYPLFFLSATLGIWFSENFQETFREMISGPNEIYLINDLPVLWLLGVVMVAGLMAVFSSHIYKWDVNLIYGRMFSKLDELMADMEELRN